MPHRHNSVTIRCVSAVVYSPLIYHRLHLALHASHQHVVTFANEGLARDIAATATAPVHKVEEQQGSIIMTLPFTALLIASVVYCD